MAIVSIDPFAPFPGLKLLSSVPSVFNLAILFLGYPLYERNSPPIRILPSFWIAIAKTELSGPDPELKLLSKEPSVFNRAK